MKQEELKMEDWEKTFAEAGWSETDAEDLSGQRAQGALDGIITAAYGTGNAHEAWQLALGRPKGGAAAGTRKMQVRVTDSMADALDLKAKRSHMSRSQAMRAALAMYISS